MHIQIRYYVRATAPNDLSAHMLSCSDGLFETVHDIYWSKLRRCATASALPHPTKATHMQ